MVDLTRQFNISQEKDEEIKQIMTTVYRALEEKGYNPINQIVGYIPVSYTHLLCHRHPKEGAVGLQKPSDKAKHHSPRSVPGRARSAPHRIRAAFP